MSVRQALGAIHDGIGEWMVRRTSGLAYECELGEAKEAIDGL